MQTFIFQKEVMEQYWWTVGLVILIPMTAKYLLANRHSRYSKVKKNLKIREITQKPHAQVICRPKREDRLKFPTSLRNTANISLSTESSSPALLSRPFLLSVYFTTLIPDLPIFSSLTLVWNDQSESQLWKLLQKLAVDAVCKRWQSCPQNYAHFPSHVGSDSLPIL